jgi:hypothetical protein
VGVYIINLWRKKLKKWDWYAHAKPIGTHRWTVKSNVDLITVRCMRVLHTTASLVRACMSALSAGHDLPCAGSHLKTLPMGPRPVRIGVKFCVWTQIFNSAVRSIVHARGCIAIRWLQLLDCWPYDSKSFMRGRPKRYSLYQRIGIFKWTVT